MGFTEEIKWSAPRGQSIHSWVRSLLAAAGSVNKEAAALLEAPLAEVS